MVFLAKRLHCGIFLKIAIFFEVTENVLCDLRLLGGTCAAELVEANVEPLVDIGMNLVVLCAQLLRSYPFF